VKALANQIKFEFSTAQMM